MASTPFDAVADLYPDDPTSICDWAVEQCHVIDLRPQNCQRIGCSKYLHHVSSIMWALKNSGIHTSGSSNGDDDDDDDVLQLPFPPPLSISTMTD